MYASSEFLRVQSLDFSGRLNFATDSCRMISNNCHLAGHSWLWWPQYTSVYASLSGSQPRQRRPALKECIAMCGSAFRRRGFNLRGVDFRTEPSCVRCWANAPVSQRRRVYAVLMTACDFAGRRQLACNYVIYCRVESARRRKPLMTNMWVTWTKRDCYWGDSQREEKKAEIRVLYRCYCIGLQVCRLPNSYVTNDRDASTYETRHSCARRRDCYCDNCRLFVFFLLLNLRGADMNVCEEALLLSTVQTYIDFRLLSFLARLCLCFSKSWLSVDSVGVNIGVNVYIRAWVAIYDSRFSLFAVEH